MNSKYIIACAGSGKTTAIINDAISKPQSKNILITSFTDENCEEIKRKFVSKLGYVPANIDILPWFTFELRHLIRPFRNQIVINRIQGISLVNGKSAQYISQDKEACYIDADCKIYSDKIALLSFKNIELNKAKILPRLNKLYNYLYIDEFQDFVGYDLLIIKEFMAFGFECFIVGDPRQKTYSTHYSPKGKQYKNNQEAFIKTECSQYCIVDKASLNFSYRCPEKIITYASKLFPCFPISHSKAKTAAEDGIYIVTEDNIDYFLKKENHVIQLRENKSRPVNLSYPVMTFGKSKGCTFENVLIYPTEKLKKAIIIDDFNLIDSEITKCKSYVALTRAKHKVGIVVKNCDISKLKNSNIMIWNKH